MLSNLKTLIILILLTTVLAGCGGGSSSTDLNESSGTDSSAGGGGSPTTDDGVKHSNDNGSPTQNTARPDVFAGIDQYADANVALTLSGSAQGKNGADIVHTQWTQRYGPAIDIPTPQQLSNIIVTPDVSELQRYTFELVATDSDGNINSDTVNIFIRPLYSAVRITSNSVNENAGYAELRVILSSPQQSPLTLEYRTQEGSARSGDDFIHSSGSITFEPGTTEKTIRVDIVDDYNNEYDEMFYVKLSNVKNGSIAQGTGTIIIRRGEDQTPDRKAQSIRFSSLGPIDIEIGDTFTNEAMDASETQHGTGAISYLSSKPATAAVDPNTGQVQAFAAGEVVITATKQADANFHSARTNYTLKIHKHSQSLEFKHTGPVDIEINTSLSNPVVIDPNQSPGTGAVSYSSSDESVAVVDPVTGEVTGISVGSAVITATKEADPDYSEATATYSLTVSLPSTGRLPQTISFGLDNSVEGYVNDTMTYAITNTGSGIGSITYASSQPGIATVDASSGEVTLIGPGTTTITATKAGDTTYLPANDTYSLTVLRLPQDIEFTNPGPLRGHVGSQISNTIIAGSPGTGLITYSSNNPSVAIVDASKGTVTLVQNGSTTITATKAADNVYDQATASYQVTAFKQTQSLVFNDAGPLSIAAGTTTTNTANGEGSGQITYSSNNTSVAEVDPSSGKVTGIAHGSAIITANIQADSQYESATASYTINVDRQQNTLSFADPGPVTGKIHETVTNIASGPGTGTITYSSANTSIATVDSNTGKVEMVGAGTTIITANQAADSVYSAASTNYSLRVSKLDQTLTFTNPTGISGIAGEQHSNPASGQGTGTIVYSSADTGVAQVDSNGRVMLVEPGNTIITATIAADSTYNSATSDYKVSVSHDITPDPFTLGSVTDAAVGSDAYSNTVTISGLSGPADISITGGSYYIGAGSPTSSPGVVSNGDTVTVVIPVTSLGQTLTATLTVGTYSDTFTVTAEAYDREPDLFSMTPITSAPPNTKQLSNIVTVSGVNTDVIVKVTNGEYSKNGGGFTTTQGTVNNGDTVQVRTVSSSIDGETVNAILTIGTMSSTLHVTTEISNQPPTVSNVVLTDANGGEAVSGDVIKLTYDYTDAENDAEGNTAIRWRSNGNVINGQSGMDYTLTASDVPGKISVEVTPVAQTGETQGSTVTAEIATGPAPTLTDNAIYIDSNMNANMDAGDQLILSFSSLVTADQGSEDDFNMPVSGDSLGTGATLSATSVSSVTNQVTISLGDFPNFSTFGIFDSSATHNGASSGIDVASSISGNSVKDYRSGLSAKASTPVDIVPGFIDTNQRLGNSDSHSVALGDMDNDGDLDMVVGNHGANKIWLNDGDGNFTDSGQNLGTFDTEVIKLADVDRNGYLDVITCNFSNEGTRVYLNDNQFKFTDSGQILGDGACRDIAVADVDNDQFVDLVVANVGTTGTKKLTRVWINDGNGGFKDTNQELATNDSIEVELGDLTGDGIPELLIGLQGSDARVFSNNGEGTFSESYSLTDAGSSTDIKIRDIDGDGDLDAILANGFSPLIFTNDGEGLLALSKTLVASRDYVEFADVNGDNLVDLISTVRSHSSFSFHTNDNTPSFGNAYSVSTGGTAAFAIAVGDIDGDGDDDIVQASGSYLERSIENRVYKHSLSGSYPVITPQ